MLALTLHRPWPWAIFHLPPESAKRVENRTWKPPATAIGTRIAIHAGGAWDWDGADFIVRQRVGMEPLPSEAQQQGIIGTVLIAGWRAASFPHDPEGFRRWFFGPFGWVLDDVRALSEPIPCKGAQRLWRVPDDIATRLAA